MGNILSSFPHSVDIRGRKRKRDDDEDSPNNSTVKSETDNVDLHTPKRKRIKSTSKYIYETLFLKGENSDVKIIALGKEWALHKLYLCQAGYFSSMFSGSWKESSQSIISIDVTDQNIDESALKIAFGSLYKDDVFIKPVQVISVLGAATLLQLDGLIQQCVILMKDTVSASTVCSYYFASLMYGLPEITKLSFDWLLHNLMVLGAHNVQFLKDVSEELMEQLVSSPELWVFQVEMDVYSLLKEWIFLRHTPSWGGNSKQLNQDTAEFFKTKRKNGKYFLEDSGLKFCPVFQAIRWQHVINDMPSVKLIETDRIVPKYWLDPLFEFQWYHLLHVEQGLNKGPNHIDKNTFLHQSMRCGRMLPKDGEFCWRWVGYNYGFDLLIQYHNRLISLKRNTSGLNHPGSVSLQPIRNFYVRLTVSCCSDQGSVESTKTTGIKKISLGKDEETVVLAVESCFKFPLFITMNLLFTLPIPNLPMPHLGIHKTCETRSFGSQTTSSHLSKQKIAKTIVPGDPMQADDVTDCPCEENNSELPRELSENEGEVTTAPPNMLEYLRTSADNSSSCETVNETTTTK